MNGYLNENGVTINLNSAKALNSVVGHEITHVLEGTELYDALAKSITEYAKSKGEYDARLKVLTELYRGREGYTGEDADAKIQREVVADLVGDYLFSDSDFIRKLSTEQRNVFEKLFDEIKYLCKVAAAGSKEARQLEKVKKAFEDAYRTETKNPTEDGGVKYSLVGRTADGLGIYKTNYPPNTPKSVKQADLISLVQNVWSNEPITLKIVENGEYKDLIAKFNPELESRSDLAKIAFGNRKGTAAEQRMTLDLASDLYQIATEAKYNYSKDAIPKPNNPAHDGVTKYHYFLTNLVYKSYDGEYIPCHMNIDVKKNADGEWFYSFAIEKGSAPQTLLAAVTEDSATLPTNMIDEFTPNVNNKNSLSSAGDDTQPVRGGVYGKDVLLEGLDSISENTAANQDIADSELVAGLDAMAENADVESQYAEPFPSEEDLMDAELREMDDAFRVQAEGEGYTSSLYDSGEGGGVDTVARRLEVKKQNAQWELEASQKSRQEAMAAYDEKIASLQAKYDAKPNKHTKAAEKLNRQIQRMQRMKADRLGE